MGIAQQYQLCLSLISLEAKYNGIDRFLRNKSLATLCITALMNNLGYTDRLFQQFIACSAPHDFLLDAPEIPGPICSLFQRVYSQFAEATEEDRAKLDANLVFFLITTPIINAAMQIADAEQAMTHATAIKGLTANTKSTLYRKFFASLYRQIAGCREDFTMPNTKSSRQMENDCLGLRNEAQHLSCRDQAVLVSWPTVFKALRLTPDTEDKIQETRCHNMINWYLKNFNPNNLNALDRAVGDTAAMMDAIKRKHQNWLTPALIDLARRVYNRAREILSSAPEKDHRMKLLEIEITLHLNELPSVQPSTEEKKFQKLQQKK